MQMKSLVLVAAILSVVGVAHAQEKRVSISSKATWDEALTCYQYYTVAAELARKLEKDPKSSADQAAGFQLQALAAKRALSGWSGYIEDVKGKRTKAQIDADLKKVGDPVVADVNAALDGDKAAAARGTQRGEKCSSFETIEESSGGSGHPARSASRPG
jgi:hypothetical protein